MDCLLSGEALLDLQQKNVIENSLPEHINAASIDVTLGRYILVEDKVQHYVDSVVSLKERTPLHMKKLDLRMYNGYVLEPGEFILAHTQQIFNLPPYLSADYKLKSSMARVGLEHMNAGWADAGWHGSVLTLEFKNVTRYHSIRLLYGDRVGQVIFFEHKPVPEKYSYKIKGSYNNNAEVSGPRNR